MTPFTSETLFQRIVGFLSTVLAKRCFRRYVGIISSLGETLLSKMCWWHQIVDDYCWLFTWLLLNDDNTEFVVIGTKPQLAKVQLNDISIGQCKITPTSSVRNLGVWFDSTLSMNSHVNKTCSLAFYYLYNIRKIRKYLSRETSEKLIHAFVRSRIDYCNRLLFGLTAYQIHQTSLNTSGRRLDT